MYDNRFGTFAFGSEVDRAELGAREKTLSFFTFAVRTYVLSDGMMRLWVGVRGSSSGSGQG